MSPLSAVLRADLAANRHSRKGQVVLVGLRVTQWARGPGRPRWWALPVVAAYRVLVDWVMGIEIPPGVQAGPGLAVFHGTGLVIHADTRLGAGVVLRHGVTLGTLGDGDDGVPPTIGDRVSIGAGAIVLGPITVGDDAVIGAGAVVIRDVPAGATVVGNPARVVRRDHVTD
jgi:putative colanic acid biosynthesis acetyltransferase WcaB